MNTVFVIEVISAAGSMVESIWSSRELATAEQQRLNDGASLCEHYYLNEIALDLSDGYFNPVAHDK